MSPVARFFSNDGYNGIIDSGDSPEIVEMRYSKVAIETVEILKIIKCIQLF